MRNHSILLEACVLALVLLQAGGAAAQGIICLPGVNPQRVEGNFNIVTPCELEGTEVTGNVTLFAGGSLVARNIRVRGNLVGSSADFVQMDGGRVDKNFRLEQMVGDLIRIQGVDLRGAVELVGNRSRLEVLDNQILRDTEIDANVGGVLITGNTFEQSLRCADNDPAPLGAGNVVTGAAEGQCESLQLEPPENPPPPSPPPPSPPPPSPPPPSPPPPSPPPPSPPPPSPPPPSPPPPSPPPPSPPPPSSPPATPSANFVPDPNGGGGGAMGLFWLALLPLAVWRRVARR